MNMLMPNIEAKYLTNQRYSNIIIQIIRK